MTQNIASFVYLTIAIVAEVIATSTLKATAQFTRLGPSLIVIVGYGTAFYCLTLVLKTLPVSIVYAIWSGLGIVLVSLVAVILYREIPDLPTILGTTLIIAGVVIINIWSKSVGH